MPSKTTNTPSAEIAQNLNGLEEEWADLTEDQGIKFYATSGTAEFLKQDIRSSN